MHISSALPTDNFGKKGESAGSSDWSRLRQQAESLLKSKSAATSLNNAETRNLYPASTGDEILKLIYELEVHQIELEMQNRELILAREQVEIAAEKYAELYDFAPSGYFTVSREGIITELNFYGSKLLGKERSYLKNRKFNLFISVESKPVFNHFFETLFTTSKELSCDVTLASENSEPVYLHLSGRVAQDNEQLLIAATDTTQARKAEAEIQSKNIELQRVNMEKDKFFSIIAHDLRSPFNGFLGLTELMVEVSHEMSLDEIRQIAILMKKSAANLYRLLSNLLEWSKMQRGLTGFVPESFFIKPKIVDILDLVNEAASEKEIRIEYHIPEDLTVFADEPMFESIIRNLVSNAVKFTPKGGQITIIAELLSDNWVKFTVKDTGIGMNREIIENLFQLNTQTNRKGTEGEYSSGLGLSLCRDFIGRHGGKIWAESKVGKGSAFRFTLPAR